MTPIGFPSDIAAIKDRVSIPFLLRVLWDELTEKAGVYFGDASALHGQFLDPRGIALSCSAFGGLPYVMWGREKLWDRSTYAALPDSPVLFLRHDNLEEFADRMLPEIPASFILVTTESDYAPFFHKRRAAEILIDSPKVAHWFCAHCDIPADVEKVTPIPLGIPYPYRYDIRSGRDAFGQPHMSRHNIRAFDNRLQQLMRLRKAPRERRMQAVGDFHLNNTSRSGAYGETRAQIYQKLASNPAIYFPQQSFAQFSLYYVYSQFAFVLSPHGRGLDAYRTWEALLMGAIPIVKRSALDPVFENFPVVIVDDWSEVTEKNLERWMDAFSGYWADGNVDNRLTLAHWVEQINNAAEHCLQA